MILIEPTDLGIANLKLKYKNLKASPPILTVIQF
jgi:hypothetical protein